MGLVQCDEGHWYDKSLNRFCPHCPVKAEPVGSRRTGPVDNTDEDDDESGHTIAAKSGSTRGAKPAPPKRPPLGGDARSDTRTTAIWGKLGIDPVVGWLVAIEGSHQGRDYRILSGLNTIGRDPASQICIRGDESITREKHASIFYNSRDTSFYISMEQGRSGVFVNDTPALQATLLKPYDVIEIGETKLVFVPLCGPEFRWNEKTKAKASAENEPPSRRETRQPPEEDDETIGVR
jgi:pSer/pThr/pTyr-binding forkhead associated (FHA) protein